MCLSNQWLRRLECVSLLTVVVALVCPSVMAQTPPIIDLHAGAPKATTPTLGGGLKDVNPYAEDAEAVAARYRVPETDNVNDLMAFIIYLRSFEAHDTQTYLIHRKQMPIAVKAAAEKILKVEKDTTSNAYHQASMLVLVCQVQMLSDLTPAAQQELFAQVSKRLDVAHPPTGDLYLAMQLATRLESTPNTALSAEAYATFAKVFAKSEDPEISDMGKTFVAAARRMSLLGKPIEVIGRTIDGKQFDWKAYRGKVVLIDYWFMTCKPCLDEIPNVKRLYNLYHDRGFDVVGVNVDDSRAEVEAFVKNEGIPWVTLFDTLSTGEHPMSSYYGVIGYPTLLLVGKDGNVVSLEARGEKLQELLAKMLGPAGDSPTSDPRNARTTVRPPAR